MVAIDEASLPVDEILQRCDLERIAALDHQPHLARYKTDDAVFAWIKPFPAGLNALRTQSAARQMHARKIAGPLRQRHQRILVADIAQINADARFAVEQLAQF